jgi:YbbR domain-containing protein
VRLLTENFGAKVLSVVAALLLWVALVDEPNLIETVPVPIEYRNLNPALDLSPDAPAQIQIQVRGPRTRLGEVNAAQTNIVLDLGQMQQPSTRTFTITPESLNLPNRVTLVRAMPSQVRVKLERRITKPLPVAAAFVPSKAFKVLQWEVSPATLQVAGPESRVSRAESVLTEPIDLAAIDPSKPLRLNALLSDAELSFTGSAVVIVKLSVEKIGDTKQD